MSDGGAGAAAAAALAQAIKASGVVIRVEPFDFLTILDRQKEPLVVCSTNWMFGTRYNYLNSYKGLAFFTKSKEPVELPSDCEIIMAKTIWVPS